ncbi:hypothetical protein C464_02625 [Halorubrum coriense DSM 10284]|uniref:Uncharacterized protein n=1 Tax=Halorubrum coriense DSM 10284 TaxID=1227466 RepID=M0EVL3_9EURY|nr:hypothetical protein C464_02625 [Halorubrum coriense DSM 10284]
MLCREYNTEYDTLAGLKCYFTVVERCSSVHSRQRELLVGAIDSDRCGVVTILVTIEPNNKQIIDTSAASRWHPTKLEADFITRIELDVFVSVFAVSGIEIHL